MKRLNNRNANIELMRLVFMYLICLVHAIDYNPMRWLDWRVNVSCVGVIGFVLISGYFGIKFKISKALKIEGVGIGCAITVIATAWLCGCDFALMSALTETLRLFKGYWFIHAYVVMMVLASLVPSTSTISFKYCLPFFLMIYGWSFLMLIPGIQHVIPRSSGLEPYGGLTLFATYLVGRLYRQYDCDNRFSWPRVSVVFAISMLFVATLWPPHMLAGVFARYNSPFLVLAGICLFWMLRKIHVSDRCLPVLMLITPSVLSIYLLHCNDYGYRAFGLIERQLAGGGGSCVGAAYVLAFFAVIVGIVLDFPRRCFVHLIRFVCNNCQKYIR